MRQKARKREEIDGERGECFEDERNRTIAESNRLDLTNSCPEESELSKWENRAKEGKNGAAAFTGKWVHEESWFPATNRPAFHLRGNAVSKGGLRHRDTSVDRILDQLRIKQWKRERGNS